MVRSVSAPRRSTPASAPTAAKVIPRSRYRRASSAAGANVPIGFPARRHRATASAMAACTSGCPGSPRWPMSAARSEGPMKSASTPGTAAMASSAAERRRRLELHDHAQLALVALDVVGPLAPAARALARGHAADPSRGVTRGSHRRGRLLRASHEGHEQGRRARVQQALDEDGVVPGRTHDRRRGSGLEDAKLVDDRRKVVRPVFGVDHDPVVARARDHLGHGGAAQRQPEADLALAGGDLALEGVLRQVHQWISGSAMGAVPSRKSKSQPRSAWVTWRA